MSESSFIVAVNAVMLRRLRLLSIADAAATTLAAKAVPATTPVR